MIEYFFWSLMGVLLLSGLMTVVIGSIWVLMIALNELLEVMGVEKWKDIGMSVQLKKRLKSSR